MIDLRPYRMVGAALKGYFSGMPTLGDGNLYDIPEARLDDVQDVLTDALTASGRELDALTYSEAMDRAFLMGRQLAADDLAAWSAQANTN